VFQQREANATARDATIGAGPRLLLPHPVGKLIWRTSELRSALILSLVFGLLLAGQAIAAQNQPHGSTLRKATVVKKLQGPVSLDMIQGKRGRPQEEDSALGGDERRRKLDDDDDDDRETDVEDADQEDEDLDSDEDGSDEDEDGDEDEDVFMLDELGRVPGGTALEPCYPDLNYDFRCLPAFLDPNAPGFAKLLADCRTTFTARTTRKGQKYSAGETYWLASNAEPRCALEQLAKDVFDLHTKHMTADVDFAASRSGAEWWTLVLDAEDDVGLHWDRDYEMEASAEILVHPHLSTVTYLTNVGGPTVVLGCVSPKESGELSDIVGPIKEVFVSRPAPGKHISFDGRLLHGAPADANVWPPSTSGAGTGDAPGPRVTFLVNVWLNHTPSSAEPFPADKLAELAPDLGACSSVAALRAATGGLGQEAGPQEQESMALEVAEDTGDGKVIDMQFTAQDNGKPVTVRLPLPLKELRQGGAGRKGWEGGGSNVEGGSWLLRYGVKETPGGPEGACCIFHSTA
jgi:hypothetical protein